MSRTGADTIEYADVVIIGGGASGLAAAIELRMTDPSVSVAVIEKNSEPGRKIRATGSGRCNITNVNAEGYTEIMEFFTRIGLVTRTLENGLVYPYSESAGDVADLLISRAEELGARLITDAEAETIAPCDRGSSGKGAGASHRSAKFETIYSVKIGSRKEKRTIRSEYLILATGGKAGPTFGTTGDGYRFARSLGHSIVTPVPVLTQVECKEWEDGSDPCAVMLAGTRTRGRVTLYRSAPGGNDPAGEDSAEVFSENGEIQFTRAGISGICVFNMTRHMRYNRAAGESLNDFTVSADLFPDGSIEDYLRERRSNAFPSEKVRDVLRTVLKDNIASYVIASAGAADRKLGSRLTSDLTDSDIHAISSSVHRLIFHPTGLRGWKDAQATSGGVSLAEIDESTCESKIAEGLYITGELADRDFMCGGYNLSNAWLTGMQSAHAVASDISGQ